MSATIKLYNIEKPITIALDNSFLNIVKLVQRNIKEEAPVKTGALKESIDYIKIDKDTTLIGSDLEYAKDVELGNNKKAGNPFIQRGLANTKVTDKEINKI